MVALPEAAPGRGAGVVRRRRRRTAARAFAAFVGSHAASGGGARRRRRRGRGRRRFRRRMNRGTAATAGIHRRRACAGSAGGRISRERAWGTVREDYSADGDAWHYFPHDHARSRAYRWNEDGLAGICDRHQHICFALALWNGRDAILKERLFGLTGPQGNHGEDVKEYYFYLDSTPTHSYMKALYKYPQAAFPYAELVEENRRGAGAISRSSSCSTRASSTRIATSTSSSSTRRRRPKTS